MVVVINGTDGISTPDVVVDSIGTNTSTAVVVRTNGVERMRVDALGALLVGTTVDPNVSKIATDVGPSGAGIRSRFSGANGTSAAFVSDYVNTIGSAINLLCLYNGSTVGSISSSSTSTSYATSSDYRLKENVTPITDAASRLLALNPVRFNFIADPDTSVDGFLAHEAQAVVPESVTGEKDGEEMQAIDQSKLVPLLTAALQEALQTIKALEARVAALETPA